MRPYCKCGCGKLTKLVEKGDPKRGIEAYTYRLYASHKCYLNHRREKAKLLCDYGHTLKTRITKTTGKPRKICSVCNAARAMSRRTGIPVLEILLEWPPPENCDLCKRPSKKLHWDHNHETQQFRGWICMTCNTGLGMFQDSPEIIKLAYKYLKSKSFYG